MLIFLNKLKHKHAPKGSFGHGVLTLMTGTAIAQMIPFAVAPFLTRLYTPIDFGIWALFMSVTAILSIIATGRYSLAIILPEKEEDAVNLIALSVIIAFALGSILLIFVWLFNNQIAALLRNPTIAPCLYFIPVSLILTGLFQALNYWSNRNKKYKRLALRSITMYGITAVAQIIFGYKHFGSTGLILAVVLGQAIATGTLAYNVWREDGIKKKFLSYVKIKENAVRFKAFPLINSSHVFSDQLRISAIPLIINYFFGSSILGLYYLSMRFLELPITLISGSISQVYYQKIAFLYKKKKDIWKVTLILIIKLIMIIIPFSLIIIVGGPWLFRFFFGAKWEIAGKYSQIVMPWVGISFISSAIWTITLVLNEQKRFFLISLVYNILVTLGVLLTSYFVHDFIFTITILNLLSVISLGIILIFLINLCRNKSLQCSE